MSKQRNIWVVAVVVVALSAALLGLVLWAIISLGADANEREKQYDPSQVEQYLREQWPDYPLERYEQSSNTVYVRSDAQITFEQAKKYGEQVYDQALLDTYVTTTRQIALGLTMECGFSGVEVVLEEYSTDGQMIFMAYTNGETIGCWQEE